MDNNKNTNEFNSSVSVLLKGMENFLSSKTVVGDAIHVNDSIILPLVDVQFGMGAGSFQNEKKDNTGGGMGARISPSAILIIQNGVTKLVNVKNQDTVTRVLDMIPDVVNHFSSSKSYKEDKDVDSVVEEVMKEEPRKETGVE